MLHRQFLLWNESNYAQVSPPLQKPASQRKAPVKFEVVAVLSPKSTALCPGLSYFTIRLQRASADTVFSRKFQNSKQPCLFISPLVFLYSNFAGHCSKRFNKQLTEGERVKLPHTPCAVIPIRIVLPSCFFCEKRYFCWEVYFFSVFPPPDSFRDPFQ